MPSGRSMRRHWIASLRRLWWNGTVGCRISAYWPTRRTWPMRAESSIEPLRGSLQSDDMTSLAEQQRLFSLALRGGDAVGEIEPLQIDPAKGELTAEQRISIYRNHHRTSLAAVLVTHFPTVVAFIGGDAFDQLAADYVRQAPPKDARLAFYGDGFADFLAIDSR